MKSSTLWGISIVLLVGLGVLEHTENIFERAIGHYLKWQNPKRPQLGRIWERERQALLAQNKIESIRSVLHDQVESADSITAFKELFQKVEPAFPLVVSRKKFLQLYYDFPGQWSERIISSFELVEIDARKDWDQVLLKRFGPWITLSFLDLQNRPIRELYLSVDTLKEVQSTRTVKRGTLEEVGFQRPRIFAINQFLSILKTLDPQTQKAVFPDPRWFLAKDYHVTRVGISEKLAEEASPQQMTFGIEYDTDYFTGVLLIPVPLDIAYNLLSQIERTENYSLNREFRSDLEKELHSLAVVPGENY